MRIAQDTDVTKCRTCDGKVLERFMICPQCRGSKKQLIAAGQAPTPPSAYYENQPAAPLLRLAT